MTRTQRMGAIALATMLAGAGFEDVAAQTRLTVQAGPAQYDLSGTGWSGIFGVHLERRVAPGVRIEAGSGMFWYSTQGDSRVVMLLPEVGVALQAPNPLPIYVAAGLGHSLTLSGTQSDELTLFAAFGLSFEALGGWIVRPEVRLRIIDPWVGGVGGYTIGISKPID